MPTLFHLDSSPAHSSSVSRALSTAFLAEWRSSHSDGTVIARDLTSTSIPPVTADWVTAGRSPAETRTSQQLELLAQSDSLIAELLQADEYVFGVPMHNFGIPSILKLWIDQICRAGKTFAYVEGKPKGLLTGKKATFLIATGGDYTAPSPMASYNFVEPYLRSVFGFLGVSDTTFHTAGGTMALAFGADRETFLAPHLKAAQTLASGN